MKSNNLSTRHGAVSLIVLLAASPLLQAQTCHDNIKQSAPTSSYTLLANGIEVFDSTTQLTWKRCPEGLSGASCESGTANTYTWSDALALEVGTWRLPNIKELASLVETACYGPAINLSLFPNTPNKFFWSSSPDASGVGDAWLVNFIYGHISRSHYPKASYPYVRLVRGG